MSERVFGARRTGITSLSEFDPLVLEDLAQWLEQRGFRQQAVTNFPVAARNATMNLIGNGSPETVVPAPVGTIYHRLDGGAGTSVYVKESGASGNTGWVGK